MLTREYLSNQYLLRSAVYSNSQSTLVRLFLLPYTFILFHSLIRNIAIVIQRFIYGTAEPLVPPDEEDILEQALRMDAELDVEGNMGRYEDTRRPDSR